MHTTLVVLHVLGATGALIAGALAFAFPNGTPRHRLIGKLYLLMWTTLALSGAIIGARRPGITPFEILNALGFGSVLYAYSMILRRRRLGRAWLRQHYTSMLTSMAFLVIATINQILPRIGIVYPLWVFGLLCLAPFPINTIIGRRLDRRYGVAVTHTARESRSPA